MSPATQKLVKELCHAAVHDISWATEKEKKLLQEMLDEGFVTLRLEDYEKLTNKYGSAGKIIRPSVHRRAHR